MSMRASPCVVLALVLVLGTLSTSTLPAQGEVAIYTGATSWFDKTLADAQAQICADRLNAAGILTTIFPSAAEDATLAGWLGSVTDNGDVDVLILFGWLPGSIYPAGNTQPEGSLLELFIESTDGDAVINHADWMFHVSSTSNGPAGLQNVMDIPGIQMGPDDTPVFVTDQGRAIAPSLGDFLSDRPLHLDLLAGEWFVEASLAQNAAGTRADPVIVRDGNRGRIIPALQSNGLNDAKGAVAAEIIAWLMDVSLLPTELSLSGPTTAVTGTPVRVKAVLVDGTGSPTKAPSAVTVALATNTATGRFDTVRDGSFGGAVTSVTIPEGAVSATFYYRDSTAGLPTITATPSGVPGLAAGSLQVNVLPDFSGAQGEVAIYTGRVGWIDKVPADLQAQICVSKLNALGVANTWFANAADEAALANWVLDATDNGAVDVLVLYGFFPPSIYAAGNTQTDGSLAELFIESEDGDLIINHADYMFYVTDPCCNDVGGIQNMMDIPGITMWDDNTSVTVTPDGRAIAPSLSDYLTDRPFHVDELAGNWFPEVVLAENASGTRADPIVVRDGNLGRLAPVYQASFQDDPKGAVAAEIIAWLYGLDPGGPVKVAISGMSTAAWAGEPIRLTVQIQDKTGSPSIVGSATTVGLQTTSAAGRFDTSAGGPFNGTVTSVTIPAGASTAEIFYRDTAAGSPVLTATSGGLESGTMTLGIFVRSVAPPGEVAVYTGITWWIDKALADAQADICIARLEGAGIPTTAFRSVADDASLAAWVTTATNNDQLDVLVLYGDFPDSIYPGGNTQPDGSIAELFIESTDGDVILNHADWMFYGQGRNGPAGLQNMMDIPSIGFGADNTPMVVTADGREIAPSLNDFLSDRPLFLEQLSGDWLVEAALARNADGTQADPVIVRDGDRGRLIPVYQTNGDNDPKGAVAAEIIAWLMETALEPTRLGLTGAAAIASRTPVKFRVALQDEGGVPVASGSAVTVDLSTSSASGAFDTVWDGTFAGTATVTIPAGELSAAFYYKDAAPGPVTLSAADTRAPGLTSASLSLNVLENVPVSEGQVAIYTGNVGWIDKGSADAQAQICIDGLSAAGITSLWFASPDDEAELASWVEDATDNGELDVLVLYGYFPPTIYAPANAVPDGSLAELFIESEDGDVIINHADYMFYVSSTINDVGGLQNMMDIPGIAMWGDDTPMVVTYEGSAIAPSLVDFVTDRPFHVDELAGNWFVEAALAENASGTRADPIIVRDGNRGRLIPVHQASFQDDPKGAVAAEIIVWLMEGTSGETRPIFRRGDADADGTLNITDAIFILNYLFLGGGDPSCLEAANADDDAMINITDGIFLLNYLFLGGTEPPAPGPDVCGPDPVGSESDLGCALYTSC